MTGSASPRRPRLRNGLYLLRWVLPATVILAGVAVLVARRDLIGLEAFAMFTGAGLSIWLLNFLYRVSVSGDRDREDEDRARAFFAEHGRWPDDPPSPREAPAHRSAPVISPSHRRPAARPRAPRRPG